MNSAKHLPEPWHLDEDFDIMAPDAPGDPWRVAKICKDAFFEGEQPDNTEANARRIVACVNACAGIPTEIIEKVLGKRETIGSDFLQMHAENKAVTEQNRELLEALNGLFWRVDNMMPWDRQEPLNTMMINARAAIAKATNQAT